ncbi:HAD family hydrolase [Rhizobium sp. 2YAF20]|uniref:HAD family hydrolase n=1 Tax=Rhizobium sp. 2YAF20 TaxID=3233027 RepID=UPI003F9CF743
MVQPPKFSLLFDLDGTLADTDALHLRAFQEVLQGCDSEIDESYYRSHIAGRTNARIIAEAFPEASAEERLALAARKERFYRANLAGVTAVSGASEILEWARESRLRCAVVTTSPRESVEAVLGVLGLRQFFSFLVAGDEVERGKPDPLPYLTALRTLGISERDAVAFEDSLSGIASACAAGLPAIGLVTSLDEEALIAAGAVRTARDFRDVGMRQWLATSSCSSPAEPHRPIQV